MIEDEFYDSDDYRNFQEFRAKAYAYGLYFNFKRKNRYRRWKTPVEILKEIGICRRCSEKVYRQINKLRKYKN
jgi:hypothetical protein